METRQDTMATHQISKKKCHIDHHPSVCKIDSMTKATIHKLSKLVKSLAQTVKMHDEEIVEIRSILHQIPNKIGEFKGKHGKMMIKRSSKEEVNAVELRSGRKRPPRTSNNERTTNNIEVDRTKEEEEPVVKIDKK